MWSFLSLGLVLAVVEELLALDLVVLTHGVDADLFNRFALAGGVAREVECEVGGELAGAVEVRAAHGLGVDVVVALPELRLVNDRLLAAGFVAVTLHRDDVGGV